MAFAASPQPAQRGEPGVSLLFTPTSKAADGQKGPSQGDFRSFSGLGRTPASAGRGFGGGPSTAGAHPTPSSRRRSLTPASSRQMDTPPPPPMDSLLDSPGGLGPGSSAWAAHGQDGAEDMQMSTSPYARAAAAPSAAAAGGRDVARAGGSEGYEDTWVTVFGFGPSDMPLVIREFSKAGDIQQFGTFGEASQVNWVHLQYQNKHAAQRALLRNGDQLSAACMVGVKPLDAAHRAAVDKGAAGGTGVGSTIAFPKPQQPRPYTLQAASGAGAMVPLASKGVTQRLKEFVLGW